ncbi:MAG TPA: transposase [Pirellulaceae bacterium]|jgi:type I restriction enzyme R subunit/putative DNA methylase
MTRKPETISFWTGRLPHWEVVNGRYFVTIHLSGAIPAAGKQQIRTLSAGYQSLSRNDPDQRLKVHRHVFRELEQWLDRAERITHLRDQRVAEIVVEAIEHRRRTGVWDVFEYVVMPNHVHLFFELLDGSLKETLENFKEWTGKQAGKFVPLNGARFWQKEWFDHWSRSDEEDERIAFYIRQNPVKAGLVGRYEDWPYGSWRLREIASEISRSHASGPAGPAGPTKGPAE